MQVVNLNSVVKAHRRKAKVGHTQTGVLKRLPGRDKDISWLLYV